MSTSGFDGDTAQIEELLATANISGSAARNAWLAFNGVVAYLLVTIASTTQIDLLLNGDVTLPILNIGMPVTSFYGFAPVLLLVLHTGLLVQHAIVAGNIHRLQSALTAYEESRYSNGGGARQFAEHVRSRLTYYIFCQSLLPPQEHNKLIIPLGRLMIWASLLALPLITFLAFQIRFLPYHHMSALIDGPWAEQGYAWIGITWQHRFWLLADIAMLAYFGPIIRHGKPTWRLSFKAYRWFFKTMIGTTLGAAAALSVLVITIPDEATDRWTSRLGFLTTAEGAHRAFWPTALLFDPGRHLPEADDESAIAERLLTNRLFTRRISVTPQDLAEINERQGIGTTLRLSGRDLRYADLQSLDLAGADLSGARLQGADLTEANLQGANLRSASLDGARLFLTDLRGANMTSADLRGTILIGGALTAAILTGADLLGARLMGADLRGADLEDAELTLADLQGADLSAANLVYTNLDHADLSYANIWGAALIDEFSLGGPDGDDPRLWRDAMITRLNDVWLPEDAELRSFPTTPAEQRLLFEELRKSIEDDEVRDQMRGRLALLLPSAPPPAGVPIEGTAGDFSEMGLDRILLRATAETPKESDAPEDALDQEPADQPATGAGLYPNLQNSWVSRNPEIVPTSGRPVTAETAGMELGHELCALSTGYALISRTMEISARFFFADRDWRPAFAGAVLQTETAECPARARLSRMYLRRLSDILDDQAARP